MKTDEFAGITIKHKAAPSPSMQKRLLDLDLNGRDKLTKDRAGNGEVRLRVLSLGWGVQSWFLAAASARGEFGLEKLDYAFHADTTFERQDTYAFAELWTPYLEKAGIKVEVVKNQEVADTIRNPENGSTFMPLFTKENATGEGGMLNRACTDRLKVAPIRKRLNEILVSPEIHSGRKDNRVEQWLGISYDEWYRAKNSSVRYIKSRHPLLELKLTRQDCLNYLLEWFGLSGIPSKSSCTQCPYHGPKAWWELINRGGPDLENAIAVDEANRNKRPGYTVYVHSSLKPLREVAAKPQQMGMFLDYGPASPADRTNLPVSCEADHCEFE